MNLKSSLPEQSSRLNSSLWAVVLCLLLPIAAPVFADGAAYLAPGHPDSVALLAPPPVSGSAEEAADLATARAVFQGRTADENARAMKDSSLSFSLFAPAIGPIFQLGA